MDFATYTITLLLRRDDAPPLPAQEADRLQDAHMSHLADLHDAGELLAVGPVLGGDERDLRGFAIYADTDTARVRAMADADPAVRAGVYRHEVFGWTLPAALLSFQPGRLPRSMAQVRES